MKKSKRYLLGTLATALSLVVAFVLLNRLFGVAQEAELPERATVSELSALRNFTAINVRGDFVLEITGQPDYSIEYFPVDDTRGNLSARIEGETLVLVGFGNARDNAAPALVRIGVPELLSLNAFNVASLSLATLTGSNLDIELVGIRQATLRDNRIDALRLSAIGVSNLALDPASFAGSTLHIRGDTTVTTAE